MRKRSERKTTLVICAALSLCAALFLTACAGEAPGTGQDGLDMDWRTLRENRDWRTKQDQRIKPEDDGQVAQILLDEYQDSVLIGQSGDAWLSGSLQGQVIVDVDEDELVHLYLAGVDIASGRGPAVVVREASKLVVTLVSGTENVLADSPDYTDYEDTPACFYSVCDLTINGDGALRVYGYHEDGIRSKDRLKVLDGSIEVQAKGDGIRGNDGVWMRDAFVEIQSEENGIRTANQGIDDRGVIEVNGGALSVVAGKKGVYAASDLYIFDSVCSVNAVEEKTGAEGTVYIAEECFRE